MEFKSNILWNRVATHKKVKLAILKTRIEYEKLWKICWTTI